jgi:hypothetical protein
MESTRTTVDNIQVSDPSVDLGIPGARAPERVSHPTASLEYRIDEKGCQARPTALSESEAHRCIDCRHCVFARIDCDGPFSPFCENPTTKEFNHPIGRLHLRSLSCDLFERRLATDTLVEIDGEKFTAKQAKTRGANIDLHELIVRVAGIILLVIAVAKVVRVEMLDFFR